MANSWNFDDVVIECCVVLAICCREMSRYAYKLHNVKNAYSFHYPFGLLVVYRHAPGSVVDLPTVSIAGAGLALQSPTQFQRHSPVDGINFFRL